MLVLQVELVRLIVHREYIYQRARESQQYPAVFEHLPLAYQSDQIVYPQKLVLFRVVKGKAQQDDDDLVRDHVATRLLVHRNEHRQNLLLQLVQLLSVQLQELRKLRSTLRDGRRVFVVCCDETGVEKQVIYHRRRRLVMNYARQLGSRQHIACNVLWLDVDRLLLPLLVLFGRFLFLHRCLVVLRDFVLIVAPQQRGRNRRGDERRELR